MSRERPRRASPSEWVSRRDFVRAAGTAAGIVVLDTACRGGPAAITGAVAPGTISGLVSDLQGAPQGSLGTLILMYGNGRQVGARATPDAAGRFAFQAVPPGKYQLRFDAKGLAIVPEPFPHPIRFVVLAGKDTFVPVRIQLGNYHQNLVEIYAGDGFFQEQPDGRENGEVVVRAGANVCWYNVDTSVHTVTGGPWGDSGDLRESEAYLWPATLTGTFAYRCKYHQPQEQATLRVTP